MSRGAGLIVFFLIQSAMLRAGEGEYAVTKIDPSLLKNAHAVLRLEELRFEIGGTGKAVYRNHYVVTILDEYGDSWSDFVNVYDRFRRIESVEGVLYDASGNAIKKMKMKDMD